MTAQVKLGYKQTDVGVIPEDWAVEPLFNVSDKIMVGIASSATHAYRREGIPLLRNQNIKAGYLDDSEVLYVDPEYESTFKNKRLEKGDLLIARTGYPGTTCVVPSKYESAQSFTTLIVRPDRSKVDSNYLCYYLNSEYGQKFFEQSQIGGAQKNVNAGKLKTMPVPVQLLPEQRAIAAALYDMDMLISGLDQLIAKKCNIKQATMQQLLTGKQRLPGFSGEWELKQLADLANIQRGASPRPIDNPVWFDDRSLVGWVRISDVTRSTIFLTETTQRLSALGVKYSRPVSRGSLIMSICATVGRPVITKIDTCIHDGFVVFDDLKTNKYFTYYILKFIECNWSKHGQTGSQMNLNTPLINSTKIPVPSDKEQAAIASTLSDLDSELAILATRREKALRLKQGMMQELLTGRTRLA